MENLIKERPILFSAPMVCALLDGSKTQTRRIVKPLKDSNFGIQLAPCEIAGEVNKSGRIDLCPYGKVGDRLWVRETFQPVFADGFDHDSSPYPNYKTGYGYAVTYPATDGIVEFIDGDDNITSRCRPSIHMPRWASRINLEITGVRVERLNDISDEDCRKEGISCEVSEGRFNCVRDKYTLPWRIKFLNLWESINGAGSWKENPWVWVLEFKRI